MMILQGCESLFTLAKCEDELLKAEVRLYIYIYMYVQPRITE